MAKVNYACPKCEKKTHTVSEFRLGKSVFTQLECGHVVSSIESLKSKSDYSEIGWDGNKLYEYQEKACQFGQDSNFSCLFNLEMGLGKTPISCSLLKVNREILTPTLIVCPAGLIRQWSILIYKITGQFPMVVSDTKSEPCPAIFPISIVSYSTLGLSKWHKDESICSQFKSIILDETQYIKNQTTKRTIAVNNVIRNGKIVHRIGLSGTPIANNIQEYYPILNIIKPEVFYSEQAFLRNHVRFSLDSYGRVKTAGLRDPERFKELTSDYILRLKREEVLPDLPKIQRTSLFVDLSVEVEQAYNDELEKLSEEFDEGMSNEAFMNILAYMSRMRHLTGLSKIKDASEFIKNFLASTDRNITVFTHHIDVAEFLHRKLTGDSQDLETGIEFYKAPILFKASMNSAEKGKAIEDFLSGKSRILIIPTTAGVGINLQPCADAVILEHEWTSVAEDQAEARFPRPGATAESIRITRMVAVGTIDEDLLVIKARKAQMISESIDGLNRESSENIDQVSILRELAEVLSNKGRKRWTRKN